MKLLISCSLTFDEFKDFQAPVLFSSTFKTLNFGEKIQVLSSTRGNRVCVVYLTFNSCITFMSIFHFKCEGTHSQHSIAIYLKTRLFSFTRQRSLIYTSLCSTAKMRPTRAARNIHISLLYSYTVTTLRTGCKNVKPKKHKLTCMKCMYRYM